MSRDSLGKDNHLIDLVAHCRSKPDLMLRSSSAIGATATLGLHALPSSIYQGELVTVGIDVQQGSLQDSTTGFAGGVMLCVQRALCVGAGGAGGQKLTGVRVGSSCDIYARATAQKMRAMLTWIFVHDTEYSV